MDALVAIGTTGGVTLHSDWRCRNANKYATFQAFGASKKGQTGDNYDN